MNIGIAVALLTAIVQGAAAQIGIGSGTPPEAIAVFADGAWASPCGRAGALEYVARVGELAATSGVDLASLTRAASADPGVARLEPVIAQQFERRAREARLTASSLGAVPMTVDRLYADAASPQTFYFEASKRIPDAGGAPDDDPTGTVRLVVSGWLRATAGRVDVIGTKGELHWEQDDRPSPSPGMTPLGIVSRAAERVWVMQERTGDRVWFTLYQVDASQIRLLLRSSKGC